MVIYGVHVHVGLDRREKALPVLDGLVNYFPHFQALSASSPFWGGEDTGYASQPRADVPAAAHRRPAVPVPLLGGIRVLRPGHVHHRRDRHPLRDPLGHPPPLPLGTVEMRICDGLATLEEVGAVAALTQCLVHEFSTTLDNGGTIPTMPPWHVQENKWRAARYGMEAIIILDESGDEELVTDSLDQLVGELPAGRRGPGVRRRARGRAAGR